MTDSILIDKRYIGFISNRLKNFQNKGKGGGSIASFTHDCERNDSRKRRGYFLEYKGMATFVCHNCGARSSFGNFLKNFDGILHKEWVMDCFREGIFGDYKEPEPVIKPLPEPKIEVDTDPFFEELLPFKNFPPTYPALLYVQRRQIPEEKIRTFFLAKNFYRWAKQFEPVFAKFPEDHPRLVIPYYGSEKKLLGFACRAFKKESPKYIQLRLDKEKEFLYGLDTVDVTKKILVVEGQIDSMFISNAIAVGNANYGGQFIKDHKENVIIVPDNDWRRNKDVCKQLEKAINNGFSICLFPDHWKKDVNDIVKSGITKEQIHEYIDNNTVQGLSAKLQFTLEKKC